MQTIGIDIGGTKIAAGLVSEDGALTESKRVVTPAVPAEIEDAVVGLVTAIRELGDVRAVGVAAAGFINHRTGVVTGAPNISWRNEPLRDRLQDRLGLPVDLENDANAAGWAEFRFGAGRGCSDMVMLTMGTGVGGAVITDGVLNRGATGMGAELGHIRYERDGLLCGCGQRGCIEQYASGRALQRVAGELADAGGIGVGLAAARAAANGELSGAEISRLVLDGDRGANEAMRIVACALGEACGTYEAILDPDRFVIGGGVSALGEILLAPMREAFRTHRLAGQDDANELFHIAQLVNDAGVIGAGDLARGLEG